MSWLRRKSFIRLDWWIRGVCLHIILSLLAVMRRAICRGLIDDRLRDRYQVREVFRTDLPPILNAPGRLESAKRTIVRCQLENIAGSQVVGRPLFWVIARGKNSQEGRRAGSSRRVELRRVAAAASDHGRTGQGQPLAGAARPRDCALVGKRIPRRNRGRDA